MTGRVNMTGRANIQPQPKPLDPFTGRVFDAWSDGNGPGVGNPIRILEYRDGLARVQQLSHPSRRNEQVTEATWLSLTRFVFLVPHSTDID